MMGLACLFMVACNNAPKQEVATETTPVEEEQHECPLGALVAQYANWDSLDDTMKAELNQKALEIFAAMDAQRPEMEEGEGHQCHHDMPEMTEEQKAECEAKCAEMKAKWDAFETLSIEEQRELIVGRIEAMMQHHHGDRPCCQGEEGHQCQHEGEGHQCQHEGEGHQCQHAAE